MYIMISSWWWANIKKKVLFDVTHPLRDPKLIEKKNTSAELLDSIYPHIWGVKYLKKYRFYFYWPLHFKMFKKFILRLWLRLRLRWGRKRGKIYFWLYGHSAKIWLQMATAATKRSWNSHSEQNHLNLSRGKTPWAAKIKQQKIYLKNCQQRNLG